MSWETTKIKGDVKQRAKDVDATYSEIMQAGIEALTTDSTQGNTHTTTTDTEDVVNQVVTELKNEISMANEPGVEVDTERIINRIDDLENQLPKKVAREVQK